MLRNNYMWNYTNQKVCFIIKKNRDFGDGSPIPFFVKKTYYGYSSVRNNKKVLFLLLENFT